MKRILAGVFAAGLSLSSLAATQYPLSLMSTTGSTAGQVPVSTGPTSPAAWGNVSISTLTGILPIANGGTGASTQAAALIALLGSSTIPVLNGGTGVTTAAAELSRIGAGATASPLSQFATTTSAQFAGVISDETGTGALVFATGAAVNPASTGATTPGTGAFTTLAANGLITPSSTVGIKGTATNDSAQAGSVGEYPTPATTLATSATTGIPLNAASISLTAGDWDVTGVVGFNAGASATVSFLQYGLSTTSATLGSFGTDATDYPNAAATQEVNHKVVPLQRISLSATTTVYLVAKSTFSSTLTVDGFIRARRVR